MAAGVAHLAEGIVREGGCARGAVEEGSVGDELLESLDDAVARDLDGTVGTRVVAKTNEVFAKVGALRSLAES